MRGEGRSLRTRTIAAIWAVVRGQGKDEAWLYAIASDEMGRLLQAGFGLTTCTDQELGRILVRVKREVGMAVQEYGRGTRDEGRGTRRRMPRPMRANGEARASLEQYRLMQTLREELHLSPEEFVGVAVKATGKPHSTASKDLQKIIEALKAIRARRQKAASSRQQAGAGV